MRLLAVTLALALLSLAFAPAPFPKAERPARESERGVVRVAGWSEGQRERRSAFVIVRGGRASAVLTEGERVVHVVGEKPQRELTRCAAGVEGQPAAEAVKNLLFHLGACGKAA